MKKRFVLWLLAITMIILFSGCTASHLQAIGAEGKDGSGLDAYLAAAKTYVRYFGSDENIIKDAFKLNEDIGFGGFKITHGSTLADFSSTSAALTVMNMPMYEGLVVSEKDGFYRFGYHHMENDNLKDSDIELMKNMAEEFSKIYGKPAEDGFAELTTAKQMLNGQEAASAMAVWILPKGAEPFGQAEYEVYTRIVLGAGHQKSNIDTRENGMPTVSIIIMTCIYDPANPPQE